jgi:hypothetical protein
MLLLFFAMQPLQPTISDPTSTRRQTKPSAGIRLAEIVGAKRAVAE